MRGAVLAYHAIGRCSTDAHNLFVDEQRFRAQMSFLARRSRVVTLAEIVKGPTRGTVAITFDDAYRSVYERALPILEHFGFPATVFVPTAYMGRENLWDEPCECPLDIMTAAELEDAARRGLDPQSHGHAHIDMSRSHPDAIASDLRQSVDVLSSITGHRPIFVAYPYGTASHAAEDTVRAAGFEAGFSIDRVHGGPFAFERVQVVPRDGPSLFALKTTGRYLRLRNAPPIAVAYRTVKAFLPRRARR